MACRPATRLSRWISPKCSVLQLCSPSSWSVTPQPRWEATASYHTEGNSYKRLKLATSKTSERPSYRSLKLPRATTTSPSSDSASSSEPPQQPASAVEDDAEKFYRYYLHDMRLKSLKIPNPGAWLQSLDADANSELPPSLHAEPLLFFAGESRDLRIAQHCLEHYIAKSSRKLPKDEQRTMYTSPDGRPGSKALSWLLQDYDRADINNNMRFLRALVHCLVLEGGERHIWSWLGLVHTPIVMSTQPLRQKIAWRGDVLRFLVDSQAFWTKQTEGINSSLRAFERSWSIRRFHEGDDYSLLIPKTAAGGWIHQQLCRNGANMTADPDLYDKYMSLLPRWRKDPTERAWNCALLHQKHPAKPDPVSVFNFLERYSSSYQRPAFLQDLFRSWTGFAHLIESARYLAREGHQSEARWILDFGRTEMPEFFMMKKLGHDPLSTPILGFGGIERRARHLNPSEPDIPFNSIRRKQTDEIRRSEKYRK